jgi:hypothetical protein
LDDNPLSDLVILISTKSEILDDFKNNMPGSRKCQRRVTGNEDINQLCWDWFQEATGRRTMQNIFDE